MRDLFGTRLELRLGDPMDSEIDRKLAALVPAGRPGRGLVPGKLHFLAALPRIDGDADAGTLGDGVDDLVTRVAEALERPDRARSCGCCPSGSTSTDLRDAGRRPRRPTGGCCSASTRRSSPRSGSTSTREPHLLVFGDGQSGKSALLRTYVHEVMRTRTPAAGAARRRRLPALAARRGPRRVPAQLPDLRDPGAARAGRPRAATSSSRIPGPDVTPEQLRNRSWWTGAEVFVVVDDYDLVATQQGSPVAGAAPLLAQARDVGLHLVVARRSGGASRALYEPVIQSLRDLAMPGPAALRQPRRGPADRQRPSRGPAPAGRGRLVTRDRGVEVVQMAWSEPTL